MSEIVTVDALGLSCPQPVLVTKKVLEGKTSGKVEVLVDTVTSRENVARMATTLGWSVKKQIQGENYSLLLEK